MKVQNIRCRKCKKTALDRQKQSQILKEKRSHIWLEVKLTPSDCFDFNFWANDTRYVVNVWESDCPVYWDMASDWTYEELQINEWVPLHTTTLNAAISVDSRHYYVAHFSPPRTFKKFKTTLTNKFPNQITTRPKSCKSSTSSYFTADLIHGSRLSGQTSSKSL